MRFKITYVVVVVVLVGVLVVLAAAQAPPSVTQAVVALQNGTLLRGQIAGRVVQGDQSLPPVFVIIEGADVQSIDKEGIRLRAGAVTLRVGMPATLSSEVYKKATLSNILSLVLPLARTKSAVRSVEFDLKLKAALSGDVDGAGIGSVPLPGTNARAFFIKEIASGLINPLPLMGELRMKNAVYSVVPELRVGTATAGVDSITYPKQK